MSGIPTNQEMVKKLETSFLVDRKTQIQTLYDQLHTKDPTLGRSTLDFETFY